MRLAWATDIHLDFASLKKKKTFIASITPEEYDGVIISGDISNSTSLISDLTYLCEKIDLELFIVLGNHDYYGSNIDWIRSQVQKLSSELNNLTYLTLTGFKSLQNDIFICGVDGWADARAGNIMNNPISINDSRLIDDLKYANNLSGQPGLFKKMQELASIDEYLLENQINEILLQGLPKEIIVVTHVPPFIEASRYNGKRSEDDFLPYFCNVSLGRLLYTYAAWNPDVRFTVLCGHTHDKCYYEKLPNLHIKVGAAQYRNPEIADIIEL